LKDTIDAFMTPTIHTIGADRTLSDAHSLMRKYHVRHLPVLKAGTLVGMVTERDLALVESLPGVHSMTVTVDDAMSPDVLTVGPETPVSVVARRMARAKAGSAVVVKDEHVVGIFTTTDALQTLELLLSDPAVRHVVDTVIRPERTTPFF
jgi:acetoin utilization protein AcuB